MAEPEASVISRALASRLVTAEQVERCRAAVKEPASEEAILELLSVCGLLTRWQMAQLQAGRNQLFFLGRYKLLEPIGSGGMGQVFRAVDTDLHSRQVAIKTLPRKFATPTAVARFRREAAAALALDHEHVVRTYELGQHGDLHFLVMELVEGTTLSRRIAALGRLPHAEAARIACEVAQALEHARQRGIVHRDIKPSNILLAADGRAKLSDLGLAKFFGVGQSSQTAVTTSGILIGTIDYLSPEQAEDAKRADTRSDIYSLGCTLYHALVGEVPFAGGTDVQKIIAHRERMPPPIVERNSEVPALLADLIEKRMLAKRADERFQTPGEAAAALAFWASDSAQASGPWDLVGELTRIEATERQRTLVHQARRLVEDCRKRPIKALPLFGKCLVWDLAADAPHAAVDLLPPSRRAGLDEKALTVFLVLPERTVKVGNYAETGRPAYRQAVEIAIVYWPALRAAGMYTLVTRAASPTQPLAAEDQAAAIAAWINSLQPAAEQEKTVSDARRARRHT